MSNNVIPLGNITKLNIDVDTVLEGAKEQLEDCVLLGWDKDGEAYVASTLADGGDVLWLLKVGEHALMGALDDE